MDPLKQVRLLVIDEQRGYFELVRQYADMCSHQFSIECHYASSTEDARRQIKNLLPSVIMLDAHLPDMLDLEIIRRYEQGLAPVIVTSDHRSSEIEESAREMGAHAYVTKGESDEELEILLYKISLIAGEISELH